MCTKATRAMGEYTVEWAQEVCRFFAAPGISAAHVEWSQESRTDGEYLRFP